MKKLLIFLSAVFVVPLVSEAPAYAAAGMLNEVGTVGIIAIIVVVGICTYLMKKFMG